MGVVDEGGDAAVGVEAEELDWGDGLERGMVGEGERGGAYPFFLLDVGGDVDYLGGPLGAVFGAELLEQDLGCLSIGRVLCDQMKTLGLRDFFRCLGDVKFVCHVGWRD